MSRYHHDRRRISDRAAGLCSDHGFPAGGAGAVTLNQFTVIPLVYRTHRGRRARRAAFYARQRLGRALTSLLRSLEPASVIDDAYCDCLRTGTGAVEVRWDRGDGEGFTSEPLRDGEWPRAMLRTVRLER